MKKIIIALMMVLTLSTLTAFAGDENVSEKVLTAFKQDFNTATDVQWTAGEDFCQVAFTYYNKHVFAFYSTAGELYGTARYISSLDLPLHLLISLKKEYTRYWISDLFEVAKDDSTSYYITLEDADNIIVLKASAGNGWVNWKKTKKS